MISDFLYQKTLINPLQTDVNRLYIVSGYASATMASRHIRDIIDQRKDVKVSLIVGMCPLDGLDIAVHNGFVELMENDNNFECKYVYKSPAVHSKLYVWCQDTNPKEAFIGSANYTQPGFSSSRKEVLASCDPDLAFSYYEEIESDTIFANHGEVEEYIRLTKKMPFRFPRVKLPTVRVAESTTDYVLDGNENKVTLSLLQRGGEVGARSGLNWGQRDGREPNQAYISLPRAIAKTGFFPLGKAHFSILTDDGKYLIMRVEQGNDKAITTPLNNSLLGEYFRNRLGLSNGQYVSRPDLERYGRTDVDFYKFDDETFYMDFSLLS